MRIKIYVARDFVIPAAELPGLYTEVRRQIADTRPVLMSDIVAVARKRGLVPDLPEDYSFADELDRIYHPEDFAAPPAFTYSTAAATRPRKRWRSCCATSATR